MPYGIDRERGPLEMVSRSQTAEDGAPREAPFITLHNEGTDLEFIRIEMNVRIEFWRLDAQPRAHLVIRALKVGGEVTAALERIGVE